MPQFDGRRSRRLRLKRPAAAMTSFGPAQIIDVAATSLALLHDWQAEKGTKLWLEFVWAGSLMRLDCEIRSTRYSRADARYRSGVVVVGGHSVDEYKRRVQGEIAKAPAEGRSPKS